MDNIFLIYLHAIYQDRMFHNAGIWEQY